MSKFANVQTQKLRASLALLLLTVVIVGGVLVTRPKPASVASNTPKQTVKKVSVPTDAASGNMTPYKNGTYMATGSYGSPGGPEKLYVTLTIVNGKVTDSALKSGSQSGDVVSMSYQKQFIDNYKPLVTGKDITTLKLGTVSGSSLTTQGFSDALKQIEQKAQA